MATKHSNATRRNTGDTTSFSTDDLGDVIEKLEQAQARAQALIGEVIGVFWENEILPQSIGPAKTDDAFQRFLQRTLAKPRREGARHE